MKALRELFHRRLVPQRRQRRLLREAGGNLFERPLQVVAGDRVGRDRRLGSVGGERLPRRAIGLTARRETARGLHRREGVRKICAGFSVDLPGREALPIEQHLEADEIAAGRRPDFDEPISAPQA